MRFFSTAGPVRPDDHYTIAPVDRPWKSLRAPARGRSPVGELGAVRPELLQCQPSHRTEHTPPKQPKHGISDTSVEAAVTPCSSEEYPTRTARPRYSVLDNAKVSAAFGPLPPWQDALDRYLRAKGYRTHGSVAGVTSAEAISGSRNHQLFAGVAEDER